MAIQNLKHKWVDLFRFQWIVTSLVRLFCMYTRLINLSYPCPSKMSTTKFHAVGSRIFNIWRRNQLSFKSFCLIYSLTILSREAHHIEQQDTYYVWPTKTVHSETFSFWGAEEHNLNGLPNNQIYKWASCVAYYTYKIKTPFNLVLLCSCAIPVFLGNCPVRSLGHKTIRLVFWLTY